MIGRVRVETYQRECDVCDKEKNVALLSDGWEDCGDTEFFICVGCLLKALLKLMWRVITKGNEK